MTDTILTKIRSISQEFLKTPLINHSLSYIYSYLSSLFISSYCPYAGSGPASDSVPCYTPEPEAWADANAK